MRRLPALVWWSCRSNGSENQSTRSFGGIVIAAELRRHTNVCFAPSEMGWHRWIHKEGSSLLVLWCCKTLIPPTLFLKQDFFLFFFLCFCSHLSLPQWRWANGKQGHYPLAAAAASRGQIKCCCSKPPTTKCFLPLDKSDLFFFKILHEKFVFFYSYDKQKNGSENNLYI